MRVKTPALFGLIAISMGVPALPSYAQVSKQGDGYLFRMKFSPNQKSVINGTILSSAGGQKFEMGMTVTQVVKSVKNGTATIDYTVNMTKSPVGSQKPTTMTVQMNNRGKMTGGSAGMDMSQMQGYELPEGPVRVGQTWSSTNTVNQAGMSMKVNSTYKLVGLKRVGAFDCAQLAITAKTSGAQMSGTGTGSVFLRLADGSMQQMNMVQNITFSMPGQNGKAGKPMSTSTTIKMSRVK